MTARWMPMRITPDPAGATVDWCRSDGLTFDDPFVDQTLEAALRHPARLLFRRTTPLAELARWDGGSPIGDDPVPLAGLVLHLSRCGSTLVTRLLGDVPGVLALSEPGVVDTLLRTPAAALGISEGDRPGLLRGLVAALGQARGPDDRAVVVKLDAWGAFHLPRLRQAFPTTPWVFVTRDPAEVLASHRVHRGYHMVPGTIDAALLGPLPDGGRFADLDDYGAFVTGRIAIAAADGLDDPRCRMVDHLDLPAAVDTVIAPHFGLVLDGPVRERWAARVGVDVKNPVLPFRDDRAAKRERIDEALAGAVERWAAGPVAALRAAVAEGAPG